MALLAQNLDGACGGSTMRAKAANLAWLALAINPHPRRAGVVVSYRAALEARGVLGEYCLRRNHTL